MASSSNNSQRTPGRLNHAQRRVLNYKEKKCQNNTPVQNWDENVEDPVFEPTNRPTVRGGRPPARRKGAIQAKANNENVEDPVFEPTNFRNRGGRPPARSRKGAIQAKANNENVEDPLWQFGIYPASIPIHMNYSQNIDFSTYPVLLERTFLDLQIVHPTIRREMPFCAFQHVCTSVLNAVVIDHIITYNSGHISDNRYVETPMNLIPDDFILPAPVAEFCKLIADSITTPSGDVVRTNLPEAGIPTTHIPPAAEGEADIPAGTFGVVTAQNHNAYEAYVSPYVTSQLVAATVTQNTANQFGPWEPLPAALIPAGSVPTENLLGYRAHVERLNVEGLNSLQGIQFPNGQNMASRLRWSSELADRVSGTLWRLQDRYKMHTGRISPGRIPSPVGWIYTSTVPGDANTARISMYMGTVRSSCSLRAWQCNIVGLMGQKRERCAAAPGYCYVNSDNNSIEGWADTINSNFSMVAPFAPTIGLDLANLRDHYHESNAGAGDRANKIQSWLRRNFLIEKKSMKNQQNKKRTRKFDDYLE